MSSLSLLRDPRVAVPVLVAAPLPVTLALSLTAQPSYPEDACFYGAPQASIDATDRYLALMTPLALGRWPWSPWWRSRAAAGGGCSPR